MSFEIVSFVNILDWFTSKLTKVMQRKQSVYKNWEVREKGERVGVWRIAV